VPAGAPGLARVALAGAAVAAPRAVPRDRLAGRLARAAATRSARFAAPAAAGTGTPHGLPRTAVIQRRVPDYAAVYPRIAGTSEQALREERKLKKIIRIAVADMRGRGPIAEHQADLASQRFDLRQPRNARVSWARMLDPQPLAEPQKLLFEDLLRELRLTAEDIERLGRYEPEPPKAQSVYPSPSVQIAPPEAGSAADQRLQMLVDTAAATMLHIAEGRYDALVQSVFPTRHADAKLLFEEAAHALLRLRKEDKIVIDDRRDQEAVHAGGLTNPTRMALARESVAKIGDEQVAVLIHESTHAVAKPTTDGVYIDMTPGAAFLLVPEPTRLQRAPYYEEVARRVLGLRQAPYPAWGHAAQPPPDGRVSHPDAIAAQERVEELVTGAWVVAINAHATLLVIARAQRAEGAWRGRGRAKELCNLSDILGLTLHTRDKSWVSDPDITDLDLAIAESRAIHLARFLKKAKWTLMRRPPLRADQRYDVSALADEVLTELVTALGHTRKSVGREKAFIRLLASVYATEDRVGALAKTTDRGAGW
jgi:hypothetical protein